jgi:hypothetical protein
MLMYLSFLTSGLVCIELDVFALFMYNLGEDDVQ